MQKIESTLYLILAILAAGCAAEAPPAAPAPATPLIWGTESQESREYSRRQADLEFQVWMKDWRRWFEYFQADGYSDQEAKFKADQMMRGR